MKRLIPLLFAPLLGKAQEVQLVLSPDYLSLIRKDSTQRTGSLPIDTTNHIGRSSLVVRQPYNGYSIGNIEIKGTSLSVLPPASRSLVVSGSFASTVELKSINRLPALQNSFVQGRSQNGALVWNGPQTGEMFSYGPSVHTLEYDGNAYEYDVHGRLVAKGSGTGKGANVYRTNIFRTGVLTAQSLSVQARYWSRGRQLLTSTLRLGRIGERLVVQDNQNNSRSMAATLEGQFSWLLVSAAFGTNHDDYTNENRNGFLNRVYQQTLLTPISFDNKQGTTLHSHQRSYQPLADNPFFLLQNNQNASSRLHQNGSLSFEKKRGPLRFKFSQSLEQTRGNSYEGLPAATAYFSNGVLVQRTKTDRHYLLKGSVSYDLLYNEDYLDSRIQLHYLLGTHQSNIHYNPGTAYRFQRSTNDITLSSESTYRDGDVNAALHLTNRFYFSNTAKERRAFLPGISGFVSLQDAFGLESVFAKFGASYHRFASESPVGASYSQHGLLKLTTAEALQYLPLTEAEGFDALSLISHKEWSADLQLRYKNRLTLGVDVFKRITQNDVFPFIENGVLQLGNLANHQNTGVEIEAGYHTYAQSFQTSHQASFAMNRSRVAAVKDGYDYTPIAGFENVHKALVKGQALGAIVGNRYLRNASGQIIIGTDGFPLVDQENGVVGNPIPDFVMKTSNSFGWKRLTLSIDVEWKKGGDVWNGTQAILDYYGRSKTSGDLRGTTGYVFSGVQVDGHPNKIPVSFYDVALPLAKNRWVRYGHSGVTEEYIENGDHIRINNLSLAYKLTSRKYIQSVTFSLCANNLLLWTAYSGGDPARLLYDTANTSGLDFFNLPSAKSFGCQVSLQF